MHCLHNTESHQETIKGFETKHYTSKILKKGQLVVMKVTSVCLGSGVLLHVEQREKESRLRYSKMDSWGFFKMVVLILDFVF